MNKLSLIGSFQQVVMINWRGGTESFVGISHQKQCIWDLFGGRFVNAALMSKQGEPSLYQSTGNYFSHVLRSNLPTPEKRLKYIFQN